MRLAKIRLETLTQHIGNEDPVELGLFEKFGQLCPVLYLIEA
jgi:hypothetical protein